MSGTLQAILRSALLCCTLALISGGVRAEVSANLLKNPSFDQPPAPTGLPAGWSLYAGKGQDQKLEAVTPGYDGGRALLIHDGDPGAEIGITQTVPAVSGLTYEVSVAVKAVQGSTTTGSFLQLRFLPSGQFAQIGLDTEKTAEFEVLSVKATAPADTKQAIIYLYTHRETTPDIIVSGVKLVSGVAPPPPPPPPPPAPVPPVYTKLKNLYLNTDIVRDGKPAATIIRPVTGIYDAQAQRLQTAIRKLTGVEVPIATDDSPAAAVPIVGNLIALGNRSTNRTIEELYNRYYCLLDLKYPGPEGSVVRSLHNPFGDGHNVLFAGGSDLIGVNAATDILIRKLTEANPRRGQLTVGWLMDIHLGKGVVVPTDLKQFETWEASLGYGSIGYFGWNSISKRLAMYYMTGDAHQAREAIRLAFPDAKAKQEIADIDGERIENKDEPLSGPYHYNAHLMVIYWDLVEESPVFTDAERLKVTNALSKQLLHRKDEGVYRLTGPASAVGSRHGQWSALSLYCLGRYFEKDYPNPIWQHCIDAAKWHFASLHKYAWVNGENDNLFWYDTGIAPVLTYMLLSGDRVPLQNGVFHELLRGLEVLISGQKNDWDLRYAALSFLNEAAYLAHDGRWCYYRDRTGLDTNIFRLGQSYWPEPALAAAPPTDLLNKWTIFNLSKPAWQARDNGFPLEQSFYVGSYRNATDASGDHILIDGFNGESRNPYHTFAILRLRIAGRILLDGYLNQVLTRADGMVEQHVAKNAALRYHDVVGDSVVAVGEVPDAAYCNWRRTLVQEVGNYALVVDDLTFREASRNIDVQTLWQGPGLLWDGERNALLLQGMGPAAVPKGWIRTRATSVHCQSDPAGSDSLVTLSSLNTMLLRAKEKGAWIEMPFDLSRDVEGEIFVDMLNYRDRGQVRFLLDGHPVGATFDNWDEDATPTQVSLGHQQLHAGAHVLRVQVVDKHPGVDQCYVGLVGITFHPADAPAGSAATRFELHPSDIVDAVMHGGSATLEWHGAVQKGEHRIFFSLLAPGAGNTPACLRLADNAAALALPTPAVAACGDYKGLSGDLVVLAADHLYGRALRSASAGGFHVLASKPVDFDWNFPSGKLVVVTTQQTELQLSLRDAGSARLDDKPLTAGQTGNGTTLTLSPGRHLLTNAFPAGADGVMAFVTEELRLATAERDRLAVAHRQQPGMTAPAIHPIWTTYATGAVTATVTLPDVEGGLIAAASGKTIQLIGADGKVRKTMSTDGAIRVLRWWPEHRLLLAGCIDEKVIAFDLNGNRKWVFVSKMDPAVFRAAKTYWFKSAPGHEGIHGLFTGVFFYGKSQAFVGSACTLEVLDENGKLVKRLPVFWGPGSKFQIVDQPDGTKHLLIAREPTDSQALAVISNKTGTEIGRSFYDVPPGHTYVGGWACMSRRHIIYTDLDGNGKKEVVSEINGSWNRVTVWDETGKPLYDASFGPGDSIPALNMRDLDVGDINGDGKQEIITSTSGGLVVALSGHCDKLWAQRMPSPPTALKVISPGAGARIVVGCENGAVFLLDGKGEPVQMATLKGAPRQIVILGNQQTQSAGEVILATDKGEIAAFRITDQPR